MTNGNTAASNTPAAGASSRSQHKAPEENVHMSVLGRDGTDLEIATTTTTTTTSKTTTTTATTNTDTVAKATPVPSLSESSMSTSSSSTAASGPSRAAAAAAAATRSTRKIAPTDTVVSPNVKIAAAAAAAAPSNNSSSPRKNWFGRMVWGSRDDTDGGIDYTSLAESPDKRNRRALLQPGDNHEEDCSQPRSSSSTVARIPTIEDQLRQDCSFFYQGLDDSNVSPEQRKQRRGGLRPLSSALQNAPRVLSRRDNALYYANYERLNQDVYVVSASDDLWLDEETTVDFQSATSPNVVDVQHSSLVYEQNGRLLMRLPRDQVRLVMDDDLEPGIVSVEQWRGDNPKNITTADSFSLDNTPSLRYVMTVPDDLYRRVVSEMSNKLYPPYWGLFKCCSNESERADIRWAIAIMLVILLLLFISTMEYHED